MLISRARHKRENVLYRPSLQPCSDVHPASLFLADPPSARFDCIIFVICYFLLGTYLPRRLSIVIYSPGLGTTVQRDHRATRVRPVPVLSRALLITVHRCILITIILYFIVVYIYVLSSSILCVIGGRSPGQTSMVVYGRGTCGYFVSG